MFGAIILLIGIIYISRLFFLQVISSDYKLSADNISQRHVTQYPSRGLIFDRNNELLVYNEAAYDLMLIPREMSAFDTLDFCKI